MKNNRIHLYVKSDSSCNDQFVVKLTFTRRSLLKLVALEKQTRKLKHLFLFGVDGHSYIGLVDTLTDSSRVMSDGDVAVIDKQLQLGETNTSKLFIRPSLVCITWYRHSGDKDSWVTLDGENKHYESLKFPEVSFQSIIDALKESNRVYVSEDMVEPLKSTRELAREAKDVAHA